MQRICWLLCLSQMMGVARAVANMYNADSIKVREHLPVACADFMFRESIQTLFSCRL